MRIYKTKDYEDMSRKAANVISAQVITKPDCVLGLATGSTPIGTYKQLIERYQNGDLDFSEVKSVNLDEYKGLPKDHDQSYYYFMYTNLFKDINIDLDNTNIPNGMEPDSDKECDRSNKVIESMGGVDLQILGLGHNGHIGFNEPGTSFDTLTHTVVLKEKTRQDNARFFDPLGEEVPTEAITMGIATIMKAKKILLVANGKNKADAVYAMIKGPVTEDCPASVLQNHPDVTVIVDRGAASKL